jgi:hypothetical protein
MVMVTSDPGSNLLADTVTALPETNEPTLRSTLTSRMGPIGPWSAKILTSDRVPRNVSTTGPKSLLGPESADVDGGRAIAVPVTAADPSLESGLEVWTVTVEDSPGSRPPTVINPVVLRLADPEVEVKRQVNDGS